MKTQTSAKQNVETRSTHKLGANRNEIAKKPMKKTAHNFSQSRDIREDRSARQSKLAQSERTILKDSLASRSGARAITIDKKESERVSSRAKIGSESAGNLLLPRYSESRESTLVRFGIYRGEAQQVYLAGSFNDWQVDVLPLQNDGAGYWSIELSLAPGKYEYRFVVNGEWYDDPLAQQFTANPFGTLNAVAHVL